MHLRTLPAHFPSSSRPVVAVAGLDVGARSTMTVSQSTAGTESLSSQTKETSHDWFLCSGGQTFVGAHASEAAPGVEGQALCLRGAAPSWSPRSRTAMPRASQVFTRGRGEIGEAETPDRPI